MSTFETVRETAMTAEERFKALVEAKRSRSLNLDKLNQSVIMEGQCAAKEQELEDIDEACAAKEQKLAALEKMKCDTATKRKKDKKPALEARLLEEGKRSVMESVLFEMVYNAYVADEDFKDERVLEMFETFKEQMQLIQEACNPKKKSKLMEEIETIVEEVCKKASKRIAKETEDIDRIEFKLNDQEEDELDDKLEELNVEQIESMVKDKVVQVIKDERDQNNKKAELIEEIDGKIEEVLGDKNEEQLSVEESFNVKNLQRKKTTIRNSFSDTIFNSIMMETTTSLENEVLKEGLSVEESTKMDTVLVESILKYTVMEMTNTLGLYEFDKYAIEKLSKRLVFKK